jgi:hypothetical protein
MAGDTKAKWCVMIYFAADNNLTEYALADIKMLKEVGTTPNVAVLAQLDPSGNQYTTRYILNKGTSLEEDVYWSAPETNTGDPNDLIEFVRWCTEQVTADNYMLVLWGHGQGWEAAGGDPCYVAGTGRTALRGRHIKNSGGGAVLDENTGDPNNPTDSLSNEELEYALREIRGILGKPVDVFGMDSCMMAMAEVFYLLRDSVSYVLASEETVPSSSWPYDKILYTLTQYPDMSAEDLARTVLWKYVVYYGGEQKAVTQSICRPDKSEALAKAVRGLVNEVLKGGLTDERRWAVMAARCLTQNFYIRDFIDLYDFCKLLKLNSDEEPVQSACQAVMDVIWVEPQSKNDGASKSTAPDNAPEKQVSVTQAAGNGEGTFVLDYGTYGHSLKSSRGLSIYFTCGRVPSCYRKLEFDVASHWSKLLKAVGTSPKGRKVVEPKPHKPPRRDKSPDADKTQRGRKLTSKPKSTGETDPLANVLGGPVAGIKGDSSISTAMTAMGDTSISLPVTPFWRKPFPIDRGASAGPYDKESPRAVPVEPDDAATKRWTKKI